NLQCAIDRRRSFAHDGKLTLETSFSEEEAEALRRMGHDVTFAKSPLGGAEAVLIDHDRNVLIAASDPRKDGCALGWYCLPLSCRFFRLEASPHNFCRPSLSAYSRPKLLFVLPASPAM